MEKYEISDIADSIGDALLTCFYKDLDKELSLNAVDGLFEIARAIKDLSDVMDGIRQVMIQNGAK